MQTRPDGQRVVLASRGRPGWRRTAPWLGVMEVNRDITAARYARSLIEASQDPLLVINLDGRITDVNQAAVLVAGVPRERVIGTEYAGYLTAPERAGESYRMQALIDGLLAFSTVPPAPP